MNLGHKYTKIDIWSKLNKECIQSETHAICRSDRNGQERFKTYTRLNTGGYRVIDLEHPGYDTPEEAKRVCQQLAKRR